MLGLQDEWRNGFRYGGPLERTLFFIYVHLALWRRDLEFGSDSEAESDEDEAVSDSSQLGETYSILNEDDDKTALKEVRLSDKVVRRDLDSFQHVIGMLSSTKAWSHLGQKLADLDIGRKNDGVVDLSQLTVYGDLTIRDASPT